MDILRVPKLGNFKLSNFKLSNLWQSGRQGTGYEKITLFMLRYPLACDGYVIRYPVGSSIPPHIDPVTDKRHFRLNIILKPAQSGGEFVCENTVLNFKRMKLFRPDKYSHWVTQIKGSPRYVLSIGWAV